MALFTPATNITTGISTPTVTLVGGAGNTVPQYTTLTCHWSRTGNLVTAIFYAGGDGGNEGAGTGTINFSLPITASASSVTFLYGHGLMTNGATYSILYPYVTPSGTTAQLAYMSSISALASVSGAMQNNTTREIQFTLIYEV